MTKDQISPEMISDDDLDGVQGAGSKLEKADRKIVMHEEMETVFMDRRAAGKGIVLSSESHEPSLKKGVVLSSETEEPY